MPFTERNTQLSELSEELLENPAIQPQARSLLLAILVLNDSHQDELSKLASRWYSDDAIEAGDFERQIWRFYSGPYTSDETLASISRTSRCDRARAEFHIGMRHLASGQLQEAERHLRLCSEANAFQYLETPWARMLLHKIKRETERPRPSTSVRKVGLTNRIE